MKKTNSLTLQKVPITFKNPVSHNSLCKIECKGLVTIYGIRKSDRNTYYALALIDSKEIESTKILMHVFCVGEKIEVDFFSELKFIHAINNVCFFAKGRSAEILTSMLGLKQ